MSSVLPLEALLIREFGVVVSSADAARLLGFRNTDALAKARGRGLLPIHMFRLPNRKGWFAETTAIALWLTRAAATDGGPSHISQSKEEGRRVGLAERVAMKGSPIHIYAVSPQSAFRRPRNAQSVH
jgi:hypothetical protein